MRIAIFFQRLVLLAALALAACALPAQAQVAAPPPPTITAADVDKLLKTIEDPEARQKFIDQLRALVNAEHAVEPPPAQENAIPERVASRMLESLSDRVASMGESIFNAVAFIADAPNFVAWLKLQANNSADRSRLLEILGNLALVLIGAWVCEWIATWLLTPVRRRLEVRQVAPGWQRVWPLSLYVLTELLPIAVFATAAFMALAIAQESRVANLVILALINASLFARALGLFSSAVLAPRNPGLRPVPLSDETAVYLHIWVRRLGNIVIFGYFAIEAAYIIGLPFSGREFLFKLLGILVALLLIVLVMQNRTTVAEALGAAGDSMVSGIRGQIARNWHLAAIFYVVAALLVFLVESNGFVFVARATGFTIVILAVAALVSAVLRVAVARLFRVSEDVARRFPHLETRANRYLQLVNVVGTAAIGALAALSILQAWGFRSLEWLQTPFGERISGSLFSIGLTIVVALALWEAMNLMITRHITEVEHGVNGYRRAARLRTVMPLIRRVVLIVLAVFCGMIAMSEAGVNIGPLLAAGGALGIAVGFGLQAFIKDFVNSAQIILEDSIAVGDVVRIGEKSGVVEAITMRRVSLRGSDGTLHIIPFGDITTISNQTKDFSFAVFDITVSYGEDLDRVAKTLTEVGAALRQDRQVGSFIVADCEVLGVDSFSDQGVVMKARVKTWPGKQWIVGQAFRRRMMEVFEAAGIETPFSKKRSIKVVGAEPEKIDKKGDAAVRRSS
jgi:moderate conductance mechanosensitive channel